MAWGLLPEVGEGFPAILTFSLVRYKSKTILRAPVPFCFCGWDKGHDWGQLEDGKVYVLLEFWGK